MSNFTIDIEKQLSRLGKDLQNLVERVVPAGSEMNDFHPHCDLIESGHTYIIQMDVPGMEKDQLKITQKDRVITISGERELYLEDDAELKRSERKQGSFSRSFALPENVDFSSVSATCKNGVLTVKADKTENKNSDSGTSIPIE
jgi:HSP20 family protein